MEYLCRTVSKSVGAGMDTLMAISEGLGPSIFCRKTEKCASYEGRDGWKGFLFPARVDTPTFDAILFDSTFPYLYFDLACKQLFFPPGKSINRRNESTTSELCRTFEKPFKRTPHNLSRAFQNLFENSEELY